MTREEWDKLKAGDVVLYGRLKRPRLVLCGPADYPTPKPGRMVTFAILHRSWTNRAYTCKLFTYDGAKIELPREKLSPRLLAMLERVRLQAQGFDWRRELRRELAEDDRIYAKRPDERPRCRLLARVLAGK